MKTTKRLILVGYTVLLSLVSTTPTPVFSQIPIQSTNIQLGMKYYSLIRYHGEPIKKDFSGDFTIALYNVVIDLGVLNEIVADYYGDSYTYFLIRDKEVIGIVTRINMKNYVTMTSFYNAALYRRIDQYGEPDEKEPGMSGWTVYNAEIGANVTEVLGMIPVYHNNRYIVITGGAKEADFKHLNRILESPLFTSQ